MRTKGKPSHSVGEEVEVWGPLPEWEAPDFGDWGAVTEDWNIDLPEWEAPEDWSIELPEWDTEPEQLPIYEKQKPMRTIEQMTREELEANVAALKNRLLNVSSSMSNTSNTEFALLSKQAQAITSAMRQAEAELKRRETGLLP